MNRKGAEILMYTCVGLGGTAAFAGLTQHLAAGNARGAEATVEQVGDYAAGEIHEASATRSEDNRDRAWAMATFLFVVAGGAAHESRRSGN